MFKSWLYSCVHIRLKVLANSRIRKLERKGMKMSRLTSMVVSIIIAMSFLPKKASQPSRRKSDCWNESTEMIKVDGEVSRVCSWIDRVRSNIFNTEQIEVTFFILQIFFIRRKSYFYHILLHHIFFCTALISFLYLYA